MVNVFEYCFNWPNSDILEKLDYLIMFATAFASPFKYQKYDK